MKKVKSRSPSGKIIIHYRREKPQLAKCANCKQPLHGVPKAVTGEMRKFAKSERRPNRPYGGYFCSSCTAEMFREKVRTWGYIRKS